MASKLYEGFKDTQMELDHKNDNLIIKEGLSQVVVNIENIKEIIDYKNYTFVFTTQAHGIIIKKEASGYNDFISELKKLTDK